MMITKMSVKELDARKAEIANEIDNEGTDLDALTEEVRSINEELETRKAAEAKKAEIRTAVAQGAGEIIEKAPINMGEIRTMKDNKEYRNSREYIEAYAEYLKSGNEEEFRGATALLTENGSGEIAIPEFVYDIIKTAWDKNEILSYVPKTEVKGNLKVNFEISGSDAVVHTEGTGAVNEENLTEGIVTLVPAYVVKWKSFSSEVMSMRGEAFVRYVYEELTHKIFKKLADELVGKIKALPETANSTKPAAAKIKAAPAVGLVAQAIGNLSDEASRPIIVMNKLTWSAFKTVQYANNFAVDPFEGLTVKFNNSLPAYSAASEGDVYMIVGDFEQGALANFPNGQDLEFTLDELTRKKETLVEVLGKIYAAAAPVACKAFVNVTKPAGV